MKLRTDLAPLAAAVTDAARALPARPPVPVLAAIRLEATASALSVAAFDYETSAEATVDAEVTTPSTVLVSGRLLADITRTIRGNDPVDLELDGARLLLTSDRIHYTLHTLPLGEYPTLPRPAPAAGTVSGPALAEAVHQVATAAGRDDALPILTGIQAVITDDTIGLAATDRYRFALRSIPWNRATPTGTTDTVTIPAKSLAEAAKILASDEQIHLTLPADHGVLGLTGHSRTLTLRAMEGRLPDHKALWPTDFTATADLDSADFAHAVKRMALVVERGHAVTLHLTDGDMALSAGTSDDASGRDRIPATTDLLTGAPVSIAFNPGYLLDAVAALNTDRVRLRIVHPAKPALLVPTDEDATALSYLIMPMR
ncbi:DNA polymerase III subunit beta (plasmid) [Streptomyces sp. NBC_00513]|uniref:DNA polymerase III subunit beta n=1 Tax=unclassified Streptomyces TaxID=2593676 RepID=UPI00225205B5|nr:DNA polymerase III subunit beta [Streptomyces sp. NBC_00424]MCX5078781.1 DNA polymerase III subunit beta [Streptomyces sp. NBC_00424]WUD46298.1 DNA polymerase III subunit beta [Streptomyces sp. NBC_00513]